MPGRNAQQELQSIFRAQCLCVLSFVLIGWGLGGPAVGKSLFCGSLVSLLPTYALKRMMFRYQGASRAQLIVQSFYIGEGVKLLLTALLFMGLIRWGHPIWWACFVGVFFTQMSLCVAPCMVRDC